MHSTRSTVSPADSQCGCITSGWRAACTLSRSAALAPGLDVVERAALWQVGGLPGPLGQVLRKPCHMLSGARGDFQRAAALRGQHALQHLQDGLFVAFGRGAEVGLHGASGFALHTHVGAGVGHARQHVALGVLLGAQPGPSSSAHLALRGADAGAAGPIAAGTGPVAARHFQ